MYLYYLYTSKFSDFVHFYTKLCILFCRDQIELQNLQEVFQSPKDFKTSHAFA